MSRQPDRRRHAPERSAYADVDIELTLMTFHRLAPTVLIGGTGFVAATALIAHRGNDQWMWNLSFFMAIVCLLRFATVVAFGLKDRTQMTLDDASRWMWWYGVPTFLQCVSLAGSTFHNFHGHNVAGSSLCTMGVFSLCAGLGARTGMRAWFQQLCGLTVLATLCFCVFRSEVILATMGSTIIAFFAFAHCEATRNQFNLLVDQLRSHRKLRQLAEQDTLTGLANRRHFQDSLAAACNQPNHPFAILYIDLDRFKAVNDTFGHPTGDLLLLRVAERLKMAVRDTDLVARLGGDEFSILQKAVVTVQDAEALAHRIVRDLSAVFEIEDHQIHIGASVGIRLSSENDRDPRVLLAHADTALYRVKQSGGGSFSLTAR